jgi:hypothetical protein
MISHRICNIFSGNETEDNNLAWSDATCCSMKDVHLYHSVISDPGRHDGDVPAMRILSFFAPEELGCKFFVI